MMVQPSQSKKWRPFQIVAARSLSLLLLCLLVTAALPAYAQGFYITEADWSAERNTLTVRGSGASRGQTLTLSPAYSGNVLASTVARRSGSWSFRVRQLSPVPCSVAVQTESQQKTAPVGNAPENCQGPPQLTALTVSGPASVNENSGASYTATAQYSDGSSKAVTAASTWTATPDKAASFTSPGQLNATEVTGNQAVVVAAEFTEDGKTVSDSINVTVVDTTPPVTLTELTVSGPAAVDENSETDYTATARYSDGTTREVTDSASWDVTPSGHADVSPPGHLNAGEVSQTLAVIVTAGYQEGGITASASQTVTVIDHSEPLQGSHVGRFEFFEGTKTCLTCHEEEALQVHDSVHYQWKGDASEAFGLDPGPAGKLGGINDFCIYPDINWIGRLTNESGLKVDGGCAKCHVGLGAKPTPTLEGLSEEQINQELLNIDCLVCHSDAYKRKVGGSDPSDYRFVPDTDKMTVSLMQAAVDINPPSKDSCLNCHTKAGGGNNFKRGDIEEAHRNPSRDFDVHLSSVARGGAGLSCLDCHTTVDHKVAGRGSDLRPRELPDEVSCTNCHESKPHHEENIDKHTGRVNCTVCHIPYFAKVAETDMLRDWSQPGDVVAATGLYEPHMVKAGWVEPVYGFFDGTSEFYQFGDPVKPNKDGFVVMSRPLGTVSDPGVKLHAFKRHEGYQPVEPGLGRLLPLKIGIFFAKNDINGAVQAGAEEAFETYTDHEFIRTERYLGLFHEVAPKEQALSCNNCHSGGGRIDFAALGYTPKTYYNAGNTVPLCQGCHGYTSDFNGPEYFKKVHEKHVKDKNKDCSACHVFSKAG